MTAFFKTKKETTKKETSVAVKLKVKKAAAAETAAPTTERATDYNSGRGLDLSMVLIRPHVTEKATDLSEHGVYAFEINKAANKMHVRHAVEKLYKVRPIKVAIVNGKPKLMKNPRTGRIQTKKTGLKKALVYLKRGDKIEFV